MKGVVWHLCDLCAGRPVGPEHTIGAVSRLGQSGCLKIDMTSGFEMASYTVRQPLMFTERSLLPFSTISQLYGLSIQAEFPSKQ